MATKPAFTAEQFEQEAARRNARRSTLAFTLWTKPDYQVNWHHELISQKLDRFVARKIKNLMLFTPPRLGKTELCSRRLPPLIFGQNPDAEIIAASYGADLAAANNRDVQRIIDSAVYRTVFPDTKISGEDSSASSKWIRNSTTFEIVGRRGVYNCAGVGGAITGKGGHYILIDDPFKNKEEADSLTMRDKVWNWYQSTLYTRREKGAGILLVQTRWHEDDLAGRILASDDPSEWEVLSLPMIAEDDVKHPDPREPGEPLWIDKYDAEECARIKTAVGSKVWSALYQQTPLNPEGQIIKAKWIQFYRELPAEFDEEIQSWDMAFKESQSSDYVVGQVWGRIGARKYLIDQVRMKMDFPTTLNFFRSFTFKHKRAFTKLVEAKANGQAVIDSLSREIPGIIAVEPSGSKEARLSAVSPDFEAGNVWLPHPEIAPWINDYISELTNFPNVKHDDQADGTSQALLRFRGDHAAEFTKELAPKKRDNPFSKDRVSW